MTKLIANKNIFIDSNQIHRGFSLVETLLSLFLSLIIVVSALEFLIIARNHFLKLQAEEQAKEAVYAALDKIRLDLLEAGIGLVLPIKQGSLDALRIENDILTILRAEEELKVSSDLVAGQTTISLYSLKKVKKGRKICIFDSIKGEMKSVSSGNQTSFTLSSPLTFSYSHQETKLVLLKEISFYLDTSHHILRRKVNSSPAQPLLEETALFKCDYDKKANLVRLNLTLLSKEEQNYESLVFPKNLGLAFN